MIPELRQSFNKRWTEAAYQGMLSDLEAELGEKPQFQIAETPIFLPEELLQRMITVSHELTDSLLSNAEYLQASEKAIPDAFHFREPDGVQPPNFMTVDFGFVRRPDGKLDVCLVELQAFPSVFGFQDLLSAAQAQAFSLDSDLRWILGSLTRHEYWQLLADVLLAGHAPEEVVLLEVTPEHQKTRIDFLTYEKQLGIRTVDITQVRQVGRRLEYQRHGKWLPIRRVFNRAIADEMQRLGIRPGFDPRADLDVEWAGHPNWYFRASKFALPFLRHSCVPEAAFLDHYLEDPQRSSIAPEQAVLKPLYSFAGRGIQFAPSLSDLYAIPQAERGSYLLQKRVRFEPVVLTPEGPTKAEIRVMLMARDGEGLQPVISMVRMGRGLMMGVDHNRHQRWVGASGVFFAPKGNVCSFNLL